MCTYMKSGDYTLLIYRLQLEGGSKPLGFSYPIEGCFNTLGFSDTKEGCSNTLDMMNSSTIVNVPPWSLQQTLFTISLLVNPSLLNLLSWALLDDKSFHQTLLLFRSLSNYPIIVVLNLNSVSQSKE